MAADKDRIANCPVCGTAFKVGSYRSKYCSDKCRMKIKCQRKKDEYRRKKGLPPGAKMERTPRTLSEKRCDMCNAAYTPNGIHQKYCPDCKKQAKKESNASR